MACATPGPFNGSAEAVWWLPGSFHRHERCWRPPVGDDRTVSVWPSSHVYKADSSSSSNGVGFFLLCLVAAELPCLVTAEGMLRFVARWGLPALQFRPHFSATPITFRCVLLPVVRARMRGPHPQLYRIRCQWLGLRLTGGLSGLAWLQWRLAQTWGVLSASPRRDGRMHWQYQRRAASSWLTPACSG